MPPNQNLAGQLDASQANAVRLALEARGLPVGMAPLSDGPNIDRPPEDLPHAPPGLVDDRQYAEALAAIREGRPYSVKVATVAE